MKIWMLTQNSNTGYDTFDSCIVAAEDELSAKNITPCGSDFKDSWGWANTPDKVKAQCIGTAEKGTAEGLILASFNAG